MALRIIRDLSNFSGLPDVLKSRIAKADAIEQIPFERRTRGQEAFLASVDKELEQFGAGQATSSATANLTPLRREAYWQFDDSNNPVKPINRFSTELYPVNESIVTTTGVSQVSAPEVVFAPPSDFERKLNYKAAEYGVRNYPDKPLNVKPNPNLPRRLNTEMDRVADSLFRRILAKPELRKALVSIPAPTVANRGVDSTIAEIYKTLVNRNPSTEYVPDRPNDLIQSVADVPNYLFKSGSAQDTGTGGYGTGLITRSDDKGRSFKRNAFITPEEADGLLDLETTVSASEPYRLVTQLPQSVFQPARNAAEYQQILREYAENPYAPATQQLSYIADTDIADAGIRDRLTPEWNVANATTDNPLALAIQQATGQTDLVQSELPGLVRVQSGKTARLMPVNSRRVLGRRLSGSSEAINQVASDISYWLPETGRVSLPVTQLKSPTKTADAAINEINRVLRSLPQDDENTAAAIKELKSKRAQLKALRQEQIKNYQDKQFVNQEIERTGADPTYRDDTLVQQAGWAGVPSGSGRLQNIFSRELALFPEQSQDIRRIPNSPIGRIVAQLQQSASGPAYQTRMVEAGLARSQAEAERLAFNNQVASNEIQLERNLARSPRAVRPVSPSAQPVRTTRFKLTDQDREDVLTDLLIRYGAELDETENATIPGIFKLSSDGYDRQLVPYTLRPVGKTGLGRVYTPGSEELIGIQVPYGVRNILTKNPITSSISYEKPPLFLPRTKTLVDTAEDMPSTGPALQSTDVAGQIADESQAILSARLNDPTDSNYIQPIQQATTNKPEPTERIAVLGFDALTPEQVEEQALAATAYGKRHFIGTDPVDVDSKLERNQQAIRSSIQRIADQVAPLSASSILDPFDAGRAALQEIEQQIQRVTPLYRNAVSRRGGDPATFEATLSTLQGQQQELLRLFRDHDNISEIRADFSGKLRNFQESLEPSSRASVVPMQLPGGMAIDVPLGDFFGKIQRPKRTIDRFGLPFPAEQPTLVTDASGAATRPAKERNLFRYGGSENFSIMPSVDDDPKVFEALYAADPSFTPGEVRKGVTWEERPNATGSATNIVVINPGTPVIDPKTGQKVTYNPSTLIGYDSQLGDYTTLKLPEGYGSFRQEAKELRKAAQEGFTFPRLERNIPLKDVIAPQPTLRNVEISGTTYTAGPRSYTIPPEQVDQGPQIIGFEGTPRPMVVPQVERSPFVPPDVTRQSKPSANYPNYIEDRISDLGVVDAIDTQDASQRSQLFQLANELGIRGAELMDSRNNFERLKSSVKAQLTSKYPERFAANQDSFVTIVPRDVQRPQTLQRLSTNRYNIIIDNLERPQNANDLNVVAATLKSNPKLRESTLETLDQKQNVLQAQLEDDTRLRDAYLAEYDRLASSQDRQSQVAAEQRLNFVNKLDAWLDDLNAQATTLQSNAQAIRQMLGYTGSTSSVPTTSTARPVYQGSVNRDPNFVRRFLQAAQPLIDPRTGQPIRITR